MRRALPVGPAFIRVDTLTGAGTPEPCAAPGPQQSRHTGMHMHVSTRRGHAHAHTGRTGIQAWLSGAHTRTGRQLLASARAPQ